MSELDEAWSEAHRYELLWLRAKEGARTTTKGLERLQDRYDRLADVCEDLRLEAAAERNRADRAERESASLRKKVERLSMRIIALWGEQGGE